MRPGKHESETSGQPQDGEHEADPQHSAESGVDAGVSADQGPTKAAGLEATLREAEARAQEHYDAFLRAKAESDNTRRRAQEDVSKAHKFGIENFAESLLPVMDSLQAALDNKSSDANTLHEGIALTHKQLLSAFERNRLVAIDPAGQKFDPHRHQAISTVPAPEGTAPNHVVNVLQKGWMLADRVLRPALVTVAS